MGKLSNIVFTANQQKEVEVLGHKIVFKSLTTRDTLSMNLDYKTMLTEGEAPDPKSMLANMLEMLSASIVSIDGIVPDSKQDTYEFLLNQEQATILEIFSKSGVSPEVTAEEIKN